ncbi:hypothetical protein JCM39068_12770 [Desulfocastanea catecholica]
MQCMAHREVLRGCKAECVNLLCHPKVQALELKEMSLRQNNQWVKEWQIKKRNWPLPWLP